VVVPLSFQAAAGAGGVGSAQSEVVAMIRTQIESNEVNRSTPLERRAFRRNGGKKGSRPC